MNKDRAFVFTDEKRLTSQQEEVIKKHFDSYVTGVIPSFMELTLNEVDVSINDFIQKK